MDKLEELLKIIQKKIKGLLRPLIEKLPVKSKLSDDEEFEEDDVTEITDIVSVDEVNREEDSEEGDDEDSDEDEDGDDEGKDHGAERLQQIKEIAPKAVLGILLLYLIIDNFFLSSDVPPIEKETKAAKTIEKPQAPEQEKEQTVSTDTKPPAVEPINVEIKTREVTKEPKQGISDIPPETSMDLVVKKDNEPQEKEDKEPILEEKIAFEDLEEVEEEEQGDNIKDKDEKDKLGEKLDSMVKDIKTKPVDEAVGYVAPPSYQRFGRGLVYNCLGKHWACVDQYSYIKCRENNKFNLDRNKRAECVIKNVYASDDDCIKVQKYYIDNNEPTSFCSSPVTQ